MAFAMTTVALMTRMGSMLTIPALLVWLVWHFGQGVAAKLRILVAACGIVFGILGMNSWLQNTYGSGPSPATGNFSFVICGLTMGTTWDGCLKKLSSEGKPFEQIEEARTKQLYSMAWENFRAKPEVFFYRIASGAQEFVRRFPDIIWRGYGATPTPRWLWRNSLTAVCLIGLLYGVARRTTAIEFIFWTLVWASIVASASIIYLDDGVRTLAASYPLMALFFAMGMSNPAASAPRRPLRNSRISRYGLLGLIVTAALFVFVPWMAHRLSPVGEIAGDTLFQKQGEAFVFGGRRMSAFLVVADGQPLRTDIPSLHLADFEAIITQSNIEHYQELNSSDHTALAVRLRFCAAPRERRPKSKPIHRTCRSSGATQYPRLAISAPAMGETRRWPILVSVCRPWRILVLRHQGGALALARIRPVKCLPTSPTPRPRHRLRASVWPTALPR